MDSPNAHPVRSLAAFAVVLLAPPLAWLVWIAPADGYAGDGANVAWFASVAAGTVLAGALAGPRSPRRWLAVVGVVSTIATLWSWWSSEDETGLFVVGIVIATPLVAAASVPLLTIGRWLSARTSASGPSSRRRTPG